MQIKYREMRSLAILILSLVLWPSLTQATTLTVSKLCSSPSTTTCFTSITSAITAANATTLDNIVIEPGVYTESFTLKNNLPISGVETASTVLQNSGPGAVITANGLTNVAISKLTIVSTSIGIQAVNSSVNISNNIFWGASQGSAIQLQGSSSGQIMNNTFFQNQTVISSPVDVTIQNNIFSTNGTAISAVSPLAQFTKVTFNDFFNNQTMGPFPYDRNSTLETNIPNPNTNPDRTNPDPKFVSTIKTPPDMDLHLAEGSPCIGTGSGGADIGAFGGSGADTIPFIISGVTLSTTPGSDSVLVSWSPNNSYTITNSDTTKQGYYNVYYRLGQSGSRTKATLLSTSTTTLISGLTTSVSQPDAPVLNEPGFANETLLLSWSTVSTATSYHVHYIDNDIASSPTNTIDVGNTNFYALSGLINGHHYDITVSAVAQPTYFFSVTAFDNSVIGTNGGKPGISHESDYSPEQSINVGNPAESLLSNTKTAFPESITPYPDLPNKGCFIATAAYGHYSAPQVQALREFRDKFLLTTAPGRAFVEWYYRYGPIGAEFITAHPWLKPAVRMALLPAVGGAMFMTGTSLSIKIFTLGVLGILLFALLYRKKLLNIHTGGRQ